MTKLRTKTTGNLLFTNHLKICKRKKTNKYHRIQSMQPTNLGWSKLISYYNRTRIKSRKELMLPWHQRRWLKRLTGVGRGSSCRGRRWGWVWRRVQRERQAPLPTSPRKVTTTKRRKNQKPTLEFIFNNWKQWKTILRSFCFKKLWTKKNLTVGIIGKIIIIKNLDQKIYLICDENVINKL